MKSGLLEWTRMVVDKLRRNLILVRYERWARREVRRDAAGRFICLLFLGTLAFGAEKVTVQVVSSQQGSWQRDVPINTGQPATAQTHCDGIDPVSCSTVGYPATPPTVVTQTFYQVWLNTVIGDRRVKLWCTKMYRDCRDLEAASYTGEIKGDSVYLDTVNLGGKKKRIKYKAVGSW